MGNNKSINSSGANQINKTNGVMSQDEPKPKSRENKKNRTHKNDEANENKENVNKSNKHEQKKTKKEEQTIKEPPITPAPQNPIVESEYTNINEYSESNPNQTNTKRYVEESFYESAIDMDYTNAQTVSNKQPVLATYVSIDEDEMKKLGSHDSDLYSQVNFNKAHKNTNQAQTNPASAQVEQNLSQFKKNKAKKFFNFNKPKQNVNKSSQNEPNTKVTTEPELPKKCFDPAQEFMQQQSYLQSNKNVSEIYENSALNKSEDVGSLSDAEIASNNRLPPSSLPPLPPPPIHTMPVINTNDHLILNSVVNNQNSDDYQSVPEYEYISSMKPPPISTKTDEETNGESENVISLEVEEEEEEEEEKEEVKPELMNHQIRPPPPPASTLPSRLSQNVENLNANAAFTTIEPFNMNNQVYYAFTSPEARLNFGLQVNSNANNNNKSPLDFSTSSYSSSSPKTSSSQSSSSAPSPSDRFVNTINVVDNKFDNNSRQQQHKVVCQVGDSNTDHRKKLYIRTANYNNGVAEVVNNTNSINSNRYSTPASSLAKTNNQEKYILKL